MVNGSVADRRIATIAISAALLLAGCNKRPEEATSAPDNSEAVAVAANNDCIKAALNNTIYEQQGDDALLKALFDQDLGACKPDFVQAYVKMRQDARDYLQTIREVRSHQGIKGDEYDKDIPNILCSLFSGSQCVHSTIQEWNDVDAALKQRAVDTKAAMEAGKDEVERVAAGYGLYLRNAPQEPQTLNNAPNSIS